MQTFPMLGTSADAAPSRDYGVADPRGAPVRRGMEWGWHERPLHDLEAQEPVCRVDLHPRGRKPRRKRRLLNVQESVSAVTVTLA